MEEVDKSQTYLMLCSLQYRALPSVDNAVILPVKKLFFLSTDDICVWALLKGYCSYYDTTH